MFKKLYPLIGNRHTLRLNDKVSFRNFHQRDLVCVHGGNHFVEDEAERVAQLFNCQIVPVDLGY